MKQTKTIKDREAALSRLLSTEKGLMAIARAIRGKRRYGRIVGKTFIHSDGSMWLVTETSCLPGTGNGYLSLEVTTGAHRFVTYYQLRRHYAKIGK